MTDGGGERRAGAPESAGAWRLLLPFAAAVLFVILARNAEDPTRRVVLYALVAIELLVGIGWVVRRTRRRRR